MSDDVKTRRPTSASRRAKRAAEDVKTNFIAVRCTATEHEKIDAAAHKSGLSIGAYVRQLALGSAGPRAVRRPPIERKELARILGHLGKVGSNVNQLAHAYNSLGQHPSHAELAAMRKEITELKDAIMAALAKRLAIHLTRTDTNERAEVLEVKGTVSNTLPGALKEMETVAAGTRCSKPFYHASINTPVEERLTAEQRTIAIDRLEHALGLTGQARVVVLHEKEGREHCHIVWSRIDLDRMAAISDSHNYRKHEEVARALEKEFGLERVQGAHVERDGQPRPGRTPSHREMLQAERTGLDAQQAKELLTGILNSTKNGKEFQAEMEKNGWLLARGDRRDFVAIDPGGGVHSIARRIEGAKAADVRERFADINPRDLKSVAEAKQVQRAHGGGRDRTGLASSERPEPRVKKAKGPREARTPLSGAAATVSKVADGLFSALMGEKPVVKEKDPDAAVRAQDTTPSTRRQELMRQLSREVTQETERDAEIETDRGRQRDRGGGAEIWTAPLEVRHGQTSRSLPANSTHHHRATFGSPPRSDRATNPRPVSKNNFALQSGSNGGAETLNFEAAGFRDAHRFV
eukprot:gene16843-17026_t